MPIFALTSHDCIYFSKAKGVQRSSHRGGQTRPDQSRSGGFSSRTLTANASLLPANSFLFPLCLAFYSCVCWNDKIWANYSLSVCKATAQPPLIQIVSPPHSLKVRTARTLSTTRSTWRILLCFFIPLLFSTKGQTFPCFSLRATLASAIAFAVHTHARARSHQPSTDLA